MNIYDKQVELFLSVENLVNPDCVLNVNGYDFITDSTIMTIIKQFYDMDIMDEDNGDISMYISLKPEFKDCGFIDEFKGIGYKDPIVALGMTDEEVARSLQIRYCLHEFTEVDLIEMVYLDAVAKLLQQ